MDARVTVVIPAWDAYVGPGLLDAVVSVMAQRCPHNLIVVDNASRTPLPALAGATVLRLPERVSRGAARNAALPSITTPYIVFLDADDTLLDDALGRLVALIDRAGGPAATAAIVDASTGERHRAPRPLAARLAPRPLALALANAVWSLVPTQGATILRAEVVRACGGYGDRDTGEDWVLAASLTLRGRIAFDPAPALSYRARRDSPGNGSIDRRTLLANAEAVRRRLDRDPAAPRRLTRLLPALALAQATAALLGHPAARALRAALTRRHRIDRAPARARPWRSRPTERSR
jgi:glycosyltransferase involved in cell wall biosynthesis